MEFSKIVKGVFNFLWETALVVIAVYYVLSYCNVSFYSIKQHFDRKDQFYESLNERIDLYKFHNEKYRLYDNVEKRFISKKYRYIGSIEDGESLVKFSKDREKYGYLNINTGKVAIPANLIYASNFSCGIAAIVPNGEKRLHFVNSKFQDIFDTTFYFRDWGFYQFEKNGYCIVDGEEGHFRGVINAEGKWILEPVYSEIKGCDDAPYYIIADSAQKYGIVDSCFNWVIEPQYDYIEQTEDCSALYASDAIKEKVIDYNGNVIAPFVVGDIGDLTYSVDMTLCGTQRKLQKVSEKVCYFQRLSHDGEIRYGLMNKHTGRIIIPARYRSVELISEDIVKCRLDLYSCRLYDISGKPIN